MGEFQYDAFVSYRRSDGTKVARWIRRELESYRAPRSLRDRFERKLRVYLDTAYESGTSDFYEHNIKPALLASRFFLIVATPAALRRPGAAAGEDWIEREVQDFTSGPNANNVIAIRAAREFDDPLPADLHHRFPNIEIIDLRGAGRLWFLHPTRAARLASEKLKLVAPLLGLPPQEMPRLRPGGGIRQQTRVGVAGGGRQPERWGSNRADRAPDDQSRLQSCRQVEAGNRQRAADRRDCHVPSRKGIGARAPGRKDDGRSAAYRGDRACRCALSEVRTFGCRATSARGAPRLCGLFAAATRRHGCKGAIPGDLERLATI